MSLINEKRESHADYEFSDCELPDKYLLVVTSDEPTKY